MASRMISEVTRTVRFRPDEAAVSIRRAEWRTAVAWIAVIVAGSGVYGASIGLWRSPLQAVFVAVKMPLLILATLSINAFLNGVLAALLGSGLSFRQTAMAILQSFALFSLMVGALGPIAVFFTSSLPGAAEPGGDVCYRILLLSHTVIIAVAGLMANLRLLRLLAVLSSAGTARIVLAAWLAGNLFAGAQLSYTFRPFFGTPTLPVQFLRPNPLEGNFYEAVWGIAAGLGRRTVTETSTIPTEH